MNKNYCLLCSLVWNQICFFPLFRRNILTILMTLIYHFTQTRFANLSRDLVNNVIVSHTLKD